VNRAYRIIRCIVPVACMRYFVSYVRHLTEVEIRFLYLPVRAAGSYEQFSVVGQHPNKFQSVRGEYGATIY